MRIQIASKDRIGISQEILAVVAARGWNIIAMEVASGFTYIQLDSENLTLESIRHSLNKIDGIIACQPIVLLPTEYREVHTKALLSKMAEPLFDIDSSGNILIANQSAQDLMGASGHGVLLSQFIDITPEYLFSLTPTTCEVACGNALFIAEITPIVSKNTFDGAVVVLKAINSIGRQISLIQQHKSYDLNSIIGLSDKIELLKQQTLKFAELDLPILITGETGTGKELFARAIHQCSSRHHAPFLAINCAALPEHLLESELFGYASGAFTGAQKGGKPGLFELAEGGTVFLDEIAEMSAYLQAKLLRFLQDLTYRRLGGTEELTADVRIISASHQHFEQLITDKLFREDLFYRLNVLSLVLPPLRHRPEDIVLLAEYFIANAAKQVNQTKPQLTSDALALLSAYPWPGNIRQLQNMLFRLVALNNKSTINQADVQAVLVTSSSVLNNTEEMSWHNITNWAEAQADFERKLLTTLYPIYPTTRKLAERLNVSHNKIAMKLREHNLV